MYIVPTWHNRDFNVARLGTYRVLTTRAYLLRRYSHHCGSQYLGAPRYCVIYIFFVNITKDIVPRMEWGCVRRYPSLLGFVGIAFARAYEKVAHSSTGGHEYKGLFTPTWSNNLELLWIVLGRYHTRWKVCMSFTMAHRLGRVFVEHSMPTSIEREDGEKH